VRSLEKKYLEAVYIMRLYDSRKKYSRNLMFLSSAARDATGIIDNAPRAGINPAPTILSPHGIYLE
jgi:hypothetical protein